MVQDLLYYLTGYCGPKDGPRGRPDYLYQFLEFACKNFDEYGAKVQAN